MVISLTQTLTCLVQRGKEKGDVANVLRPQLRIPERRLDALLLRRTARGRDGRRLPVLAHRRAADEGNDLLSDDSQAKLRKSSRYPA